MCWLGGYSAILTTFRIQILSGARYFFFKLFDCFLTTFRKHKHKKQQQKIIMRCMFRQELIVLKTNIVDFFLCHQIFKWINCFFLLRKIRNLLCSPAIDPFALNVYFLEVCYHRNAYWFYFNFIWIFSYGWVTGLLQF